METDNTPPAVAQPAPESLNWLTVVYKDIKPGKEAEALILHPKMSAASWSHALNDRDAALTTPPAAAEQEPVADAFMVHLYNLGYKSGHHDTVEGRYIDLLGQDMDTYHSDFVFDYLAETCNTTTGVRHD